MSSGDFISVCFRVTATSNKGLTVFRHTVMNSFNRKKKHDKSDNKTESITPRKREVFSLFVVIMLKREREHSGYLKPTW